MAGLSPFAAALKYARRGWPVVPLWWPTSYSLVKAEQRCACLTVPRWCRKCNSKHPPEKCDSPGKHPLTRHGLKDASTDPKVIAEWWQRWPEANVGICTGFAFDVLDLDVEIEQATGETVKNGADALDEFLVRFGFELEIDFERLPVSLTGGGGLQWLFAPTGLRNRGGMLPGLDWRGPGGYICAPPSMHGSGLRYEWHPEPSGEFPPAPAWLIALVDGTHERSQEPEQVTDAERPDLQGKAATPYGRAALRRACAEIEGTQDGEGRNSTLNANAYSIGRLVGGGHLVLDVAFAWLVDAGRRMYGPDRDDAYIEGVVRSGLDAGMANPKIATGRPA